MNIKTMYASKKHKDFIIYANKVINNSDITVNIQKTSLFTKVIGGIKKCLKK